MKTGIYFIFTSLISTGALWGGLNTKNPFPELVIALAVWALFIWGYNKRTKKAVERRMGERLFQSHMRLQYRNNQR